jgi:DNA-binding CsgD family transcriptional regulator
MGGSRLMVRTVDLSRAAAEGVDVLPDALELLDEHIGADTLSVSAMQLRATAQVRADVSLRGASPMTARELELWPALMATHPYLPHLVAGPMVTSRVTDVVDLRSFERTELYQQLLGPRGSRYQAALVLHRSPESMLLLSLWRAERDFTDREVERLEAFRVVMAAATAFCRAVEATQHAADDPDEATPGAEPDAGRARPRSLTRRQRQVAALIESGLTNDQIARRLGISSRTVRKHVEDLFELTGANTRTQVALRWRQGGRTATDRCGRCGQSL